MSAYFWRFCGISVLSTSYPAADRSQRASLAAPRPSAGTRVRRTACGTSVGRTIAAVAGGTLPSADDAIDVTTSERQDVKTPPEAPQPGARRTAFTWRLTAEEALALDEMTLRLKRQLGRPKLDKAEMLAALVALAEENSAVFGALVAQLQNEQAS